MPKDVNGTPPKIPHITANYVSLQHLINAVVQRTYAELQNILRTLGSISSDAARKREFLHFLVCARQEFVKVYVLSKWAAVSTDISQCIDVAAWLHGQHNAFNNAVAGLFHLQQGMGSATLPHADVESALQVIKYGAPLHSSYGFVVPPPFSAPEILGTLEALNVLLAIRLALSEKLPLIYRNYTIQDGRAHFTVQGLMWAELSVADDSVDAQFFYVDFGFDFTTAAIPKTMAVRLESIVNDQLTKKPLAKVFDWLVEFASNYKLSLIQEQLVQLRKGIWANVLKHSYNVSTSTVTIYYWVERPGHSELVIDLSKNRTLQLRWLIDGKVRQIPTDLIKDFDSRMPDMARVLRRITSLHSTLLLKPLLDAFPWVQQSEDEAQLLLQFSPTRSALLSVDSTSGKIILQASGELEQMAARSLDSIRDLSHATTTLERLQLTVCQETIAERASAAGWRCLCSVRFASGEMSKLGSQTKLALAMRLPSWSAGWFVVVAFGQGLPKWIAAQMQCRQRRWVIDSVHRLNVDTVDPDYALFHKLAEFCSAQFAMYELCRELEEAHVRYSPGETKLELYADLRTLDAKATQWAQSGIKLQISGDKVVLTGRVKENTLEELGTLDENGVRLTADRSIKLVLDRKDSIISELRLKLEKISKVAESLKVANSLGLKVRSACLQHLELVYADHDNTEGVLKVSDTSVAFSPNNPQEILSPFLLPLLAGGLSTLVNLLKVTYPLYQTLAALKAVIIPRSATCTAVQMSLTAGPEIPQLEVHLREFRGAPTLYITANKSALDLADVSKAFNTRQWDGTVPLMRGAAVPVEQSEPVLRHLVQSLSDANATNTV